MADPGSGAAPTSREAEAETPDRPAEGTAQVPKPSPYDDLLCTICGLKACWMTPEAAGKTGSKS